VCGKRTEIYIFGSADFRKEELRKEGGKNTYFYVESQVPIRQRAKRYKTTHAFKDSTNL